MEMEDQTVLLQALDTGIYQLTINRPTSYNALNSETLSALQSAIDRLAQQEDARVLLLRGAGEKAFVAGADIKEMYDFSPMQAEAFSQRGMRAFASLEALPIPVIAVVNGICLGGGCELAMSCDWILAADHARFGQPEVGLGVTPGFGGTQRLTRLLGRAKALELLLTARQLTAQEACDWGLVNHVYTAEQLADQALDLARTISKQGKTAVRLCKRLVQQGQAMDLDKACLMESQAFGLCFATVEQQQGMQQFMKK